MGLTWRAGIPSDGSWHALDIHGDARGKDDGRIKLFADCQGGLIANWKLDACEAFFVYSPGVLSPEESARRALIRRQAEDEKIRVRKKAQYVAGKLWERSTIEGAAAHPYTIKKTIKPIGARLLREAKRGDAIEPALIIPVLSLETGELLTVQRIFADSQKRFLKGCSPAGGQFVLNPRPSGLVLVGEGYATMATAAEATGYQAVCAFSRSGLRAVAACWQRQGRQVIILAELDTDGLETAKKAAQGLGTFLAVPDFTGLDKTADDTDFNDLAARSSLGRVRRQIKAAMEGGGPPLGGGGGRREIMSTGVQVDDTSIRMPQKHLNGKAEANQSSAWAPIPLFKPTLAPDKWKRYPAKHAKAGELMSCEENLMFALQEKNIALAFNNFTEESDIYINKSWGHLSDEIHDEIYLMLPKEFGFKISSEDCRKMLRLESRRHPYHPILQWLNALEWDGVERLDGWLSSYAGADDSPYTRAVAAIMLVAAVRRLRQPGVKFDNMVVLEGAEERGKSTALNILAGGHFTDHVPVHSDDPRLAIEAMKNVWIGEYAELSGIRKAAVEAVKAFLSRQIDRARPAYGHVTIAIPRKWIVVGTTNDAEYLVSKTGNRRFWPIRINGFSLSSLARDRNQLWAEAAQRETQGMSLELPPEVREVAKIEQIKREVHDEWQELITDWLARTALVNPLGYHSFTMQLLALEALSTPRERLDKPTQMRVTEILRNLGFIRKKMNNRVLWERKA